MNTPSAVLVWSFAILSLVVASTLPAGVYWASSRSGEGARIARVRALITASFVVIWLAATSIAAALGILDFGPFPPPMTALFVAIVVIGVVLGRSGFGTKIADGVPLVALVGVQGFRFPLELLMHRAYSEEVMPAQMSFSGLNFDIVTGIGAIIVASLLAAKRMPIWGVKVWNWAGFLLLVNIVIIAWLSTPTPLRVFTNEPANVWITNFPFVWLPSVLVMAAFVGHLFLFRRLARESERRPSPSPDTSAPPSHVAI